jgi:3-dehydroquinate synthase
MFLNILNNYIMNFSVDNIFFNGEIDLSDKITIKSSKKTYDVLYSNQTLDTLINENYIMNDFIFIDKNVYNLSPQTFINIKNKYIFEAIETSKTMDSVLQLTDLLYNNNFTKLNKLIVIGGGITQDVGGFAAAIYKRGINWIYIPTTILSMTDSCIGSKVSINRASKNILGLFVAPDKIFISDYFLKSLTHDDIISGVGEALKLSLIGGDNTFNMFTCKLDIKDYMSIIKLASLVKKHIIEYDEFEVSTRKVLNYGHTIGHAIEATTNYFIPHGIAVLIGMFIKNKLFYEDKYTDINNLILKLISPKFLNIEFNYSNFITHVLSDKKNKGNEVCFILLDDIGKTKIIYKNIHDVEYKLKEILTALFKVT